MEYKDFYRNSKEKFQPIIAFYSDGKKGNTAGVQVQTIGRGASDRHTTIVIEIINGVHASRSSHHRGQVLSAKSEFFHSPHSSHSSRKARKASQSSKESSKDFKAFSKDFEESSKDFRESFKESSRNVKESFKKPDLKSCQKQAVSGSQTVSGALYSPISQNAQALYEFQTSPETAQTSPETAQISPGTVLNVVDLPKEVPGAQMPGQPFHEDPVIRCRKDYCEEVIHRLQEVLIYNKRTKKMEFLFCHKSYWQVVYRVMKDLKCLPEDTPEGKSYQYLVLVHDAPVVEYRIPLDIDSVRRADFGVHAKPVNTWAKSKAHHSGHYDRKLQIAETMYGIAMQVKEEFGLS